MNRKRLALCGVAPALNPAKDPAMSRQSDDLIAVQEGFKYRLDITENDVSRVEYQRIRYQAEQRRDTLKRKGCRVSIAPLPQPAEA